MSYMETVTEKPAVILDIGNSYTKCGFAGEPSPICIIKSELLKNGKPVNIFSSRESLKQNLIEFFYRVYYKILNINARERRVIIVESILNPINYRKLLAEILFETFQVLSLTFLPIHLAALYTLGIKTALVVDCGYADTQILPIAENYLLTGLCESLNIGSKTIHEQLKKSLDLKSFSFSTLNSEYLTEEIEIKCCFVRNFKRSQNMNSLEDVEPPTDCDYCLPNNQVFPVPGRIREEACEHLFVDKLDNMRTIPELIINTILKAPIDLRKTFAGNIVLIGGTCQLKGFKKRLYDELVNLIDKNENYKFLTDCIRFHKPPCYDNYTAWLGASIYASLDINDPFNVSAQKYKESDILPDWFTVCPTK